MIFPYKTTHSSEISLKIHEPCPWSNKREIESSSSTLWAIFPSSFLFILIFKELKIKYVPVTETKLFSKLYQILFHWIILFWIIRIFLEVNR